MFLFQIKWEEFSTGKKIVRYDEADKLTFDIIKDEWNDFGNTSSIRIPTLRTLPAFIDKLKGTGISPNSINFRSLFSFSFFKLYFRNEN